MEKEFYGEYEENKFILLCDKRAFSRCIYLLAFIALLKECAEENPLITKCALEVLRQIPGLENITYIDEIRKQYKHIDVLIIIGNIHVIVEDKTFTQQHENQINRYVNSLVESGINKADIKTVYYKIEEQPWPENVNCEFTRRKLLSIYRNIEI